MKYLFAILFLGIGAQLHAQIETQTNSLRFDRNSKPKDEAPILNLPAGTTPSLTVPKSPSYQSKPDFGREEEKSFNMMDDELKTYNSNIQPKYFTKDKEAKPEYGKDVYLGDLKTESDYVYIHYRDHEYVDGDRIRVYVNDEMLVANVMLEAHFKGFKLDLRDGFNKIEFEALNQGTSGPNTAQLQITDAKDQVIGNYVWNLLTGNKATAIVVKN